jgi:hypothetical protein
MMLSYERKLIQVATSVSARFTSGRRSESDTEKKNQEKQFKRPTMLSLKYL